MLRSLFKEMFNVGLYKPSQGKIARRLTFLGLLVVFATGAWCTVYDKMYNSWPGGEYTTMGVAVFTLLLGAWFSYRLINFPPFADFLVSVEAEMTKVSWPTNPELISTSKVVLIFMFLFIAIIYFYDISFDVLLSMLKKCF